MIKAVIFDLDGTLARFNIDYKTVRVEVKSFLVREGIPASILSTRESIFEMLKKAEIFFKNNERRSSIKELRKKALMIAEKYELEAAKKTSLIPGVKETLNTLKNMKLRLGLFTVNSRISVDYMLKRFNLTKFFEAIASRDDVENVKPNIEHLRMVLKALNVNPSETIVVGDGVSDMKCSNELNAIAVGLPTGLSSPKELINAGANYLITSITDLPTLIREINILKS
ncbi:HAD family hydrolase [Candidatus Bathyarchaeota archaeon]|nr:MAG: HAD family hydrolase [Candidatus Bathyarchaeota archaeon]